MQNFFYNKLSIIENIQLIDFFFNFRIFRGQAFRHLHAVFGHGERIHHANEHVGSHRGYGEPHIHRRKPRSGNVRMRRHLQSNHRRKFDFSQRPDVVWAFFYNLQLDFRHAAYFSCIPASLVAAC